MPDYGEIEYWDKRYEKEKDKTFDWLESWDDVKEILEKNAINGLTELENCIENDKVKKQTSILNLGCGNSVICEDMYDEGYTDIFNMDISSVCIE